MKARLYAALRTDVVLQARNRLYGISIGVALVVAGVLAWLSSPGAVARTVPLVLLCFVGGSTLLYVVAMLILEKADGTLAAVAVSPLRPREYLAAKVMSLTALATLEAALITYGGLALLTRDGAVDWPGPLALVGVLALGAMHVLVGVIIVVRYDRLMEALIPMSAIATALQAPALWYIGALDHPALLAVPSGAPTMLIRGAFTPLSGWQWAYGLGVTALTLAVLAVWAGRAYDTHIVRKAG